MKLHHYPDTDSPYIELGPEVGTETREITDGLKVGLDIDNASTKLDLTTLETEGLLTRKTRAA